MPTPKKSTGEFEFVAEPPVRNTGGIARNEPLRVALRARPGEWAKWPYPTKNPASISQNIRRNWHPEGAWEATVRGGTLYVRYVGGLCGNDFGGAS